MGFRTAWTVGLAGREAFLKSYLQRLIEIRNEYLIR
ncbi:hypothetical protein RSal33209_2450 [Renibacterium salmoninarum ATCC 33209]|uniref:Uncharacterized protein n=1 Tax=Renibacterium salmoninarum (strain ATCC 33209 / DSM 20767 / JCM 11484 / NBRC 15589 / NCIMB 2235) TaxID=288705 RepID=A9WS47_RENSM|nr:hypothetical protein RSal33209_2450 [Renibacterium salmoninarum ATCC 33209]